MSYKLQIVRCIDGQIETTHVAEINDHNFADPAQNNYLIIAVRDALQSILEAQNEIEPWFERPSLKRKDRLRKLTTAELNKTLRSMERLASLYRRDHNNRDLYNKTCTEIISLNYELSCRDAPTISHNKLR